MAKQFGDGLGWQLRSFPVAICVDKQIHEQHFDLRQLQRQNIEEQLQECLHALSPKAKEIVPKEIIDANASMSAAFALFWSQLWNEPTISTPYIAAGYKVGGTDLLAINETLSADPNQDRKLIGAWAKRLRLDRWFETIAR